MNNRSFERELPEGYVEAKHIDAKSKLLGLVMNLVALVIFFAVMVVAVVFFALGLKSNTFQTLTPEIPALMAASWIFVISMLVYIVLHELVHGIAYKILTGEKLTFGISWSCAFCGVPSIYTYRRTAIISSAAPLAVFSAILLPLSVVFLFVNPLYYFLSAMLLAAHLSGCVGDCYVLLLLHTKYKSPDILIRDTGPAQSIYIKKPSKEQH